MPRPLDTARMEKARELYQNGKTIAFIADTLNRSHWTIHLWCRDLKKPADPYDRFFLDEDSELRSYFLGLFVADGWLSNTGVHLMSKDLDIIQDLVTATQYTNKITVTHGHKYGSKKPTANTYHRISFAREPLAHIKGLGFTTPKTGKEFIPEGVSSQTFRHFLRGVSDGDGTMSQVTQHGKQRLEWSLVCANAHFLSEILDRLRRDGVIPSKGITVRPHQMIFRIQAGHKDAVAIGEYLYQNSTLHMSRKFNIFNSMRTTQLAHRRWTDQETQMALKGQSPPGRTLNALTAVLRKISLQCDPLPQSAFV